MSEMTLPSRHKTQNLNHIGWKPGTLPLGHGGCPQYWILQVDGIETFFFTNRRWHASLQTKYLMYCSLVRPSLEYCAMVWSDTSRKNIKNIEKIKKSMTRYVFNNTKVDNKDRLLMTNILPITMRRESTDIAFFSKCLYGNYDVDVNDFVFFWWWMLQS